MSAPERNERTELNPPRSPLYPITWHGGDYNGGGLMSQQSWAHPALLLP